MRNLQAVQSHRRALSPETQLGLLISSQLTMILLVIFLNRLSQRGISVENDWALWLTLIAIMVSVAILAGLVLSWRRPIRR